MSNFDAIISLVLAWEGGRSDDPTDPGGYTAYGISHAAYPSLDLSTLTMDAAKDIYRRDYWAPLRLDEIPAPVALLVLDSAINQGKRAATTMLQQALGGGVSVDGVMGDQTIAACLRAPVAHLAHDYAVLRVLRYTETLNWPKYGHGWMNRLLDLYGKAVGL